MKILVTGCSSLQINSANMASITKINVPMSVVDALRAAGHEVDWGKVTPGDDLSMYDAAWVSLAPINSLNGRAGAMGALWTLSSHLPVAAFADDWQINAVYNGMRAVIRRPRMLTKYMLTGTVGRGEESATHWSRDSIDAAMDRIFDKNPDARIGCERYYMRDSDEEILPHKDRLIQACEDFLELRWKRGMILVCPMYSWGDHSLVMKRFPGFYGEFEPLDPSPTIYPLIHDRNPIPAEEKKRGWVLGALMPHDDWVKKREWGWDIQYLGSKTVVRRHPGGLRLKTESDVLDVYNQHWGILSPPYPHAGSGWWRSRFMYAARVRSVLCCDQKEGKPLGKAYMWKPSDIEQLDVNDLKQLAEDQANALRPYLPEPDAFIEHCDGIIRRAIREDKGGLQV